MSRQIYFHMLDDDKNKFFSFLASRHDLVTANWTASTPCVYECESPSKAQVYLAIWQRRQNVKIERRRVERLDGSIAYDFDRTAAFLEYDPSFLIMRGGTPALLQGRLYSFSDEPVPEISGIFRTARQWIKRNCESSHLKLLGGYIGPEAMQWHRLGGVLLPTFNPPETPAWEEFVASQHGMSE